MKGCQYCCESELFRTFEELNLDYVPGAYTVHEYDEELEYCPVCKEHLLPDDYIVDDKELFLQDTLEFLANEINNVIFECQYCNWTIIPYEQAHGDPINLETINDLVNSFSIPTHLHERLIRLLKCHCGNPVSFDDPYVTKNEIDDWFEEETEFIVTTFNISGEDTMEFIEFLQNYPMLGLNHAVGKEIFNKIKNKSFPGIENINPGEVYLRGRTRNKLQRIVPFIEEELWNPPQGVPNQGRYNPHGVTNLYLGNKEDAILLEISPSELEVVDIAEFEILNNLKVFNSTQTDIDIFAAMEKDNNGFTSSYAYIFPNFLSQCLALLGFNGIVYKSVKDHSASNLCLFNFSRDEDIQMTKIHQNANLISDGGPFGLEPKRRTVIIEKKSPNLTDLL